MITSSTVPVMVTAEAEARVAGLGLDAEMRRMIEHVQKSLPEATRIKVVLYERDESGEEPGVAVEVYTAFASFDPNAGTRAKIGEWLVSAFPPRVLEHLIIDYLPEAPDAG